MKKDLVGRNLVRVFEQGRGIAVTIMRLPSVAMIMLVFSIIAMRGRENRL